MTLSLNEIKRRAVEFAKEWENEESENAEAKSFWNDFFQVFGINRRRVASFEEPVKKMGNKQGFIDLFWKGNLIVEHKSKGRDLDKAYTQALDYFEGLKDYELPKYVLVSDFDCFRLYDLEDGLEFEFSLKELPQNIHLFGFISGYRKKVYKAEDPANIKAAELMGALHDTLATSGYTGHKLEVFLVRLLFCMFAEDTGIFEKNLFLDYVEHRTNEDGSDLGMHIARLFQLLDKPESERSKNLDENLNQFPYVNGSLFSEYLEMADFDSAMRDALLRCCYFDWSKISPAIFGSLFQSIMDKDKRRNLGAHYTTEQNILKLIKPLFLDELWAEFESIKTNKKNLEKFHDKLASLTFLDPACGCGNFLIITYRELRLLEIEVLKKLYGTEEQMLDVGMNLKIDVDSFYGIEIEEFPARIAEVAMWLVDHQMNVKVQEEFGNYYVRLPLKKAAKIVNDNALRMDWEAVFCDSNQLKQVVAGEDNTQQQASACCKPNYILGNPPFIGHHNQIKEQKEDMAFVFGNVKGFGVLDYVTCWYIKAAQFIQDTKIKVAFVSTNSIAQGEQVGILWEQLFKYGLKIHFAHRTFAWSSEARGKAQVYVVIVGFANFDVKEKLIYEYEHVKGEAHEKKVKNINPYLVEGEDLVIRNRTNPLCDIPPMKYGSKPTDGGSFVKTH